MKVDFICENCGNRVTGVANFIEYYFTIEKHYECQKCGFRRHWAYVSIM